MTNQLTSSPFSSDAKPGAAMSASNNSEPNTQQANQDNFMIRTMQGDLLSLQNKGHIEEEVLIQPKIIANEQTKPKPFDKNDITSQKISSSIQQAESSPADIAEVSVQSPTTQAPITEKKHPGSVRAIVAVIIILIICILGLGAYYFYLTKSKDAVVKPIPAPTPTENIVAPAPTITQPAPTITQEPLTEKYSSSKPNYLTIDLLSKSADEIRSSIIKISEELKPIAGNNVYEFIVVDNNNNPVAFPIFATAANLNLLPTILSNLGTDFSLYLYKDNSNMRLALSTEIKTKDQLMKELIKQEKTFPTDAAFLFLGATPETKMGTFATSPYGDYSIRFLNLNVNKDLSIDYTTTGSQFVLGTSKNTLRVVLDKILQETALKNSTEAIKENPTKTPDQAATTTTPKTNIPATDSVITTNPVK